MEPDATLCYCFHIPRRKVVNFVRQTLPPRASLISECFGAGTGCGWCIPFLRQIHRQVLAGERAEAHPVRPEEYEAMRKRYLEAVREGVHARHCPDRDEMPSEWTAGAPSTADAPASPAPLVLTPELKERLGIARDPGWDVSDYFSRSRPAEPEPEDLR